MAGRAWARCARGNRAAVLPGLGGQPRLQRQHLPHRAVAGRAGGTLPAVGAAPAGRGQAAAASGVVRAEFAARAAGPGAVAAKRSVGGRTRAVLRTRCRGCGAPERGQSLVACARL